MLGAVGRICPDTLSIWRMQGLTKAGGLARWPCEPELQPLTTGRRTGSASASTPAASSKRTGRRPGGPTGSNASGPPYATRPGPWCWPRTARLRHGRASRKGSHALRVGEDQGRAPGRTERRRVAEVPARDRRLRAHAPRAAAVQGYGRDQQRRRVGDPGARAAIRLCLGSAHRRGRRERSPEQRVEARIVARGPGALARLGPRFVIDAAIFDLNGTLIDDMRAHGRAWSTIVRELGVDVP